MITGDPWTPPAPGARPGRCSGRPAGRLDARGWANEGSDIDLVVVATASRRRGRLAAGSLDPPDIVFASGYAGSVGWEVKYWLVHQVEQMLDKFRWEGFEANPAAAQSIIEQEELFLERLVTAVRCRRRVAAEGPEPARRERLPHPGGVPLARLRRQGRRRRPGQAAAGDLTSAALSARSAYQHAVDALLESDDTYGSLTVKWRARRVQEAALPELPFEDYWAVETMAGCDRADLGRWVADTVKRTRRLMMATEV